MERPTPILHGYIEQFASVYELPLNLVMAIVAQESDFNVFAYRVEPPYRYLWDVEENMPFRPISAKEQVSEYAPRDFPWIESVSSQNTEWWGQQASWGPMQVMGAVAREYGFRRAFPALCTANEGVEYGCKHLARLADRFYQREGWTGVVAAYNAGSPRRVNGGEFVNQLYVDKVMTAFLRVEE